MATPNVDLHRLRPSRGGRLRCKGPQPSPPPHHLALLALLAAQSLLDPAAVGTNERPGAA